MAAAAAAAAEAGEVSSLFAELRRGDGEILLPLRTLPRHKKGPGEGARGRRLQSLLVWGAVGVTSTMPGQRAQSADRSYQVHTDVSTEHISNAMQVRPKMGFR